jgi:mannose-1-phosphate guanylyltransferase
MSDRLRSFHPCGIVLAAGEGTRLRAFVQRLRGEALPKQYVGILGSRSMLEQTLHRAQKLIPPARLFTVVSRGHLSHPEIRRQLAARSPGTVVAQPANRDTGAGLLLPLIRLSRRFPQAPVAVFPSDHFIIQEDLFMQHVRLACRLVERDPERVVLLGMAPENAEEEYGYILPGRRLNPEASAPLHDVRGFVEKPARAEATELIRAGALWSTLVMTFRADTFLDLVRRIAPAPLSLFRRIGGASPEEEARITDEVYQVLEPMNLSRDLLEILVHRDPARVTVLTVRGVTWSDWGSERRVIEGLRRLRPGETAGIERGPALRNAV